MYFCSGLLLFNVTHIFYVFFIATGAMIWFEIWQWSTLGKGGQIDQLLGVKLQNEDHTTTKNKPGDLFYMKVPS